MYKIAGHTMGTPEYTVPEAIALFRGIGLDGAEIVVQDGYKCGIPTGAGAAFLEEIKAASERNDIPIICLTPYDSDFNSLDPEARKGSVEGIRRTIRWARELGARYIRIYGGRFAQDEEDHGGLKRKNLVGALRELGEEAHANGIVLVVENHFNTMTQTAAQTDSILREIAHPGVAALYDQVNLAFVGAEEYPEAVRLQGDLIRYVHAKDLVFKEGAGKFVASDVSHVNEEERIVRSRIVGEGVMDWTGILAALERQGYEGWLSLEYERRWHSADLPPAGEGMRKGAEHLRACMASLAGKKTPV